MANGGELALDEKYRVFCDDLKLVGIDWRDVCASALTDAHVDNAFAIERIKTARKGGRYCKVYKLIAFVEAVCSGTARIAVRNGHVVDLLKTADPAHAFQQIDTVRRNQLSQREFTDALLEYEVQFSAFKDVARLQHRAAGPWEGSVGPIITVYCLEAEYQLGAKVLHIEMGSLLMRALLGGPWLTGNGSLAENAVIETTIIETARKLYSFAVCGGKCVGVLRKVLDAPDPELGIVQASYPAETEAAMNAGAAFIITDDATWGALMLHNVLRPVGESPTATFLHKFREVYSIEPADNTGGVLCVRRA